MEVIDGKWILARLEKRRGAKADLARALGLPMDMLSKTLTGIRQVQPEEVPKLLAYFSNQSNRHHPAPHDDVMRRLQDRVGELTVQEARLLLAAADGLIAHRQGEGE